MMQTFIQSVLKGIGISATGGGIALGAGQMNLVDVDFPTIVAMVIFSNIINVVYQYLKNAFKKPNR